MSEAFKKWYENSHFKDLEAVESIESCLWEAYEAGYREGGSRG